MSHDWIKETVTAEMGKGGYCDGSSSTNESGSKKNPEKQLEKYEVNKKPSAKPEKGFRSGSILQHQRKNKSSKGRKRKKKKHHH